MKILTSFLLFQVFVLSLFAQLNVSPDYTAPDFQGDVRVQNTLNVIQSLQVGPVATQDATAIIEIISTTQGILISRMTTTERDLITTPSNGLFIYNITSGQFNWFNSVSWLEVGDLSGTLTVNTLPLATGVKVLGDSIVTQDAGATKIIVAGDIDIGANAIINPANAGDIVLRAGSGTVTGDVVVESSVNPGGNIHIFIAGGTWNMRASGTAVDNGGFTFNTNNTDNGSGIRLQLGATGSLFFENNTGFTTFTPNANSLNCDLGKGTANGFRNINMFGDIRELVPGTIRIEHAGVGNMFKTLAFDKTNSVSAIAITFAAGDYGSTMRHVNVLDVVYTIPTNAVLAFPVGTEIIGVSTLSTASFVGAGVTINDLTGLTNYKRWRLKKVATDEWDLTGMPSVGSSVASLESVTVDLATTTFVDIPAPSGNFFLKEVMAIGVTDVTSTGRVDIGVVGDLGRYFNNMPVAANIFDTATDADLFTNPSVHTGATSIRITPDGTGVGTVKFILIGVLN